MELTIKEEIARGHLVSEIVGRGTEISLNNVNVKQDCLNNTNCEYHCNHQCEKFPIGSIVYYVTHKYDVSFGIVIAHFAGEVMLQKYDVNSPRIINGIPEKEFETPSRWQKLPKGWTYNSKLLNIEYEKFDYIQGVYHEKKLIMNNPDNIKKLIDDGILIKVNDKYYCWFETEIDKENGWRVIRKYDSRNYHPSTVTVRFDKVYSTYAEAKKIIDDIRAEWKRQAALSDREWSIEQIDKTLNHWQQVYRVSDEQKQKCRDWIMELKDIEDVEIRLSQGYIQWKYLKNKKWSTIELSI